MVGHSHHEHQREHSEKTEEHGQHQRPTAHGVDHTGHEQMFRTCFWWSLLLSIPVLLYSEAIQNGLGFRMPEFPGSAWIPFAFSLIIFGYGGLPFIQMAIPEVRNRQPGMMTLISLAISVAFIYSVAAQILRLGEGFLWELVTLIDIMLLGHWLEMRSVRQASGALNASIMMVQLKRFWSLHLKVETCCLSAPAQASLRMAKWLKGNPASMRP